MKKLPSVIACGLLATAMCTLFSLPVQADRGRDGKQDEFPRPLVIGHRGAHGYLPAHTLEGYALAIELGADFIEPDLVSTKDGRLIARHEPNMIATTDVASRPEFASRRRAAVIDGAADEGFFASDFTLAEIKRLRAVQDFAERPQQFNGKFEVPTLEEIIALAKRKAEEKHRPIGIYPEVKHSTYHKSIGLPIEKRLVGILAAAGWNHSDAPVIIQSFEQSNLKELRKLTPLRLIQLIDANDVNPDGSLDFTAPSDRPFDWTASGDPRLLARTFGFLVTDEGLREVKTYADGIGPWKRYIVSTIEANLSGPGEASRKLLPASNLIERAHKIGLLVHTWTFRNEQRRLFSDYADTAVAARILFQLESNPDAGRCLTGDRDGPKRHQPECPDQRD